ncbi:S1/P1 nuclease [Cladochytrium replicatum]|nr:S1/P1 nuclease [Cladochytrium replicatum]
MVHKLSILIATLFAHTAVSAFGFDGHFITAKIAESLLSPAAVATASHILRGANLSDVASWADEIKGNRRYSWTSPLHYINPVGDFPPTSCAFRTESICSGGSAKGICLTEAIANYTRRLSCLDDNEESAEALKFLIHFIGDIHQPLHACSREKGGNSALVRYHGRSANLHSVWDTLLIKTIVSRDFAGSRDAFIQYLYENLINSQPDKVPTWSICERSLLIDPSTCVDGDSRAYPSGQLNRDYEQPVYVNACPNEWAAVSNRLNCDVVWAFETKDDVRQFSRRTGVGPILSDEYIEIAEEVIQDLLMMAGLRMAVLLNELLDPQSCNSHFFDAANMEEFVAQPKLLRRLIACNGSIRPLV